ncbi:IPT/TIG domain-containing protein [Flavobacterium sp. ST-87]|uniref:IPT/TIG domain-containing protein n=1 Tax=Flavobacterium plantiphilum TaxID=3163297 RepID=A0ABW8XWJ0_9FLAO
MKIVLKFSIKLMMLIGTLITFTGCQEEDANFKIYEYPEFSVTDFSPVTARPTQELTINGSNFGTLKPAVTVYFNGIAVPQANIVSVVDDKIIVTVPDNTQSTGQITVKVWKYTKPLLSSDFTFITGGQVTSVSPLLGLEGDLVTIVGKNFGTVKNDIKVAFGGVYGEVISVTDTQIQAKIPVGGITGTMNVYVGLQKIDAGFFLVDAEKITATIIGTPGSWNNNANATIAAAFDGNTSTFVDGAAGTTYYLGYDFGATVKAKLKAVRFYPRATFASRMLNAKIYGTNDPTKVGTNGGTLLATISVLPLYAWNQLVISDTSTSYRYIYYFNDTAGNGNNVAEIEFYGKKE